MPDFRAEPIGGLDPGCRRFEPSGAGRGGWPMGRDGVARPSGSNRRQASTRRRSRHAGTRPAHYVGPRISHPPRRAYRPQRIPVEEGERAVRIRSPRSSARFAQAASAGSGRPARPAGHAAGDPDRESGRQCHGRAGGEVVPSGEAHFIVPPSVVSPPGRAAVVARRAHGEGGRSRAVSPPYPGRWPPPDSPRPPAPLATRRGSR
jgi:hypothetical protein